MQAYGPVAIGRVVQAIRIQAAVMFGQTALQPLLALLQIGLQQRVLSGGEVSHGGELRNGAHRAHQAAAGPGPGALGAAGFASIMRLALRRGLSAVKAHADGDPGGRPSACLQSAPHAKP